MEAAPQVEALAVLRAELEQLVAAGDTRGALMCVNKAAGHYDTELAAFVRCLRSEAQERVDSSIDAGRATTHAKRPYSSRVSSSTS